MDNKEDTVQNVENRPLLRSEGSHLGFRKRSIVSKNDSCMTLQQHANNENNTTNNK